MYSMTSFLIELLGSRTSKSSSASHIVFVKGGELARLTYNVNLPMSMKFSTYLGRKFHNYIKKNKTYNVNLPMSMKFSTYLGRKFHTYKNKRLIM